MAIFSKKTEEKKEKKDESSKAITQSGKAGFKEKEVIKTPVVKSESKSSKTPNQLFEHVIRHPRVTEKANNATSQNAYIFDVDPRSNKIDIAKAIKILYGVVPVRVNTLRVPSKSVLYKGKKGVKAGGKKAIIYLKKGDSIEIV